MATQLTMPSSAVDHAQCVQLTTLGMPNVCVCVCIKRQDFRLSLD